jgi:thiamine monophosphate synthase
MPPRSFLLADVTLLQYRNKSGNARVMLEQARELKKRSGVFRQADHE